MSYEATKWADRTATTSGTKLNADHLNNIEGGISALDIAVTDLTTKVNAIDLTEAQLNQLKNISDSLTQVQSDLSSLKAEFDAHVHSNEAGDTTGKVTTDPTSNAGSGSSTGSSTGTTTDGSGSETGTTSGN